MKLARVKALLQNVEIPISLSVILYFCMLVDLRSNLPRQEVTIYLYTALLICFLLILLFSVRKVITPHVANYLFLMLIYMIFSAFFILAGLTVLYFYIFLFIQIFVTAYLQSTIFIIAIPSVYILNRLFSEYMKLDYHNLLNMFLEYLFMVIIAWTILSFYRETETSKISLIKSLRKKDELKTLLEIVKYVSSTLNLDEILHRIATKLGVFSDLERSSFVIVDKNLTKGIIAASYEGRHLRKHEIDLDKYPEIRESVRSGKIITVKDPEKSSLMQRVSKFLEDVKHQSIMVIPIKMQEEVYGVLFLRGERNRAGFTDEEIEFCSVVAEASTQAILNARLYEELDDKAIQLSEAVEKLKKMNKEIEEANHLKSVFVANVSHELRTPLTAVIGYLQLLESSEQIQEENLSYVGIIKNNSKTLLRMINELLDISKIESGTFEMIFNKANLNDICFYACDSIRPSVKSNGLKIEINLEKYDHSLFLDEKRIEQVINNLLVNSIKYSFEGSTITVKTEYDKNWATVLVKDEGIGIPAADRERIFDRFVQLDGENNSDVPGAGIGLHLCREIIKRHGGKIWVKSKKGKGSSFYFQLPLIRTEEELQKLLNQNAP